MLLGSEQQHSTDASRESCEPSCSGVQVPGHSSEQGENLNIIARRPFMASQLDGVITPVVFSFNSLSILAESDEHGNARFTASDACMILGYKNCRPPIHDKWSLSYGWCIETIHHPQNWVQARNNIHQRRQSIPPNHQVQEIGRRKIWKASDGRNPPGHSQNRKLFQS